MLDAIVLAGGASTRMGSPKALLATPLGDTFLERIVTTLTAAGVARITVVTGSHHEAIIQGAASLLDRKLCGIVRNPDPSRGQLSSLIVGMDTAVQPGTAGLLVTLVDVPMVTEQTVRQLVDVWQRRRPPIVRPAIGSEHGHPVIFDQATFARLREAPLDSGAKGVVRSYGARVENVMVTDRGCVRDIDTPEDYARLG
jgi:molybdenum cofactor cytidylyltransferase